MFTTRTNRLFSLLGLSLLLWGCLCTEVAANGSGRIGKIIALRGQAQVTAPSGEKRPLAIGSEIALADVIKTGRRCRLQIMFADNTIVSLGPASEFMVEEYAWDAQSKQGKMASRVNEGVFRVLGGSITKSSPQNFTTETPSATIGIRGSMYAGRVRDGQLAVVFQGGRGIYVSNDLGSVDISTPGYGTRLDQPDQPPQEPYQVPKEELEQLDPVVATAPPASVAEADTADTAVGGAESVPADGLAAETETVSSEPAAVETAPLTTDVPVEVEQPAQETLTDTVIADSGSTTTTPPTPTDTASLSGQYLAVLQEDLNSANSNNQSWVSSLSGLTSGGQLTGTATNSPGPSIGPYTVTGYDPSLSYSGVVKHSISRTVTLLGTATTFSGEIINDNTGEFSVLNLVGAIGSAPDPVYTFREIGFLGTATTTPLPTSGISWYSGPLAGTLESVVLTGELEGFGDQAEMVVNWSNQKVFGVVEATGGKGGSGFFFGNVDVSGSGFTVTHFFGNDILDEDPTDPYSPTGDPILAIDGAGSGQFYGEEASGFSLVANGGTYLVQYSQPQEENWQFVAAGFRDPTLTTALTGKIEMKGFAIGVGEDMASIDVNRRLFMNSSVGDFSLLLDRDTGQVDGTVNLADIADPSVSISNLKFGTSNGSVYISDDIFAALADSATIKVDAGTGGLKPYGNYLLTEDPNKTGIASYASWGTWEIAYVDPFYGGDYHVHMPSSYWVAGELTDPTALAGFNFTATYNGRAEGVYVPVSGGFEPLEPGTIALSVDFGLDEVTGGSLSFPEKIDPVSMVTVLPAINLNIGSIPIDMSNGQFNAPLQTPDVGTVNGAFYGPNAESVAGSFEALIDTGSQLDQIMGVYGGDR